MKFLFNGYEIVDGAAVNCLFQYYWRKGLKKLINGYEIVNVAAVKSFVVLTALTVCQIVNGNSS